MVWTQAEVLPHSSVAVQVRAMVPQPLATVLTSVKVMVMLAGEEQLSVAEAVPVKAGRVLARQSMVRFDGQVMTGGVLSFTVMICVAEAVLLQASVADQVRKRVKLLGHVPGIVVWLKVTTGAGSQLSVAETIAGGGTSAAHW